MYYLFCTAVMTSKIKVMIDIHHSFLCNTNLYTIQPLQCQTWRKSTYTKNSRSNRKFQEFSRFSRWVGTLHMGLHGITCLPPSRGDIPTFTLVQYTNHVTTMFTYQTPTRHALLIKAGTQFSDPGRMQGWVDLAGLVTYRGGTSAWRKTVTHPSTNWTQHRLTLFMQWKMLLLEPSH